MKIVFDWIVNHPETVASILCAILTIVIWVIKKKPIKVVDTLAGRIITQLPFVISLAEKQFGAGHGSEKLQFVIGYFRKQFEDNGLELGSYHTKFIVENTEAILSTPQKKEKRGNAYGKR